jgi:hypothetical protein
VIQRAAAYRASADHHDPGLALHRCAARCAARILGAARTRVAA